MIPLSKNIYCIIPDCCVSKCEDNNYLSSLKKAFEFIRSTDVGRRVLSEMVQVVHITTHPKDWTCAKYKRPESYPQNKGPYDPKISYGSVIYIDPRIHQKIHRFFTHWHFHQCIERDFVTPKCLAEDSRCNRSASFVQILFHELVHARNTALGQDQSRNLDVAPIYTNMEEAMAIKYSNQMLREMGTPTDELQYGHKTPDHPEQIKEIHKRYRDKPIDLKRLKITVIHDTSSPITALFFRVIKPPKPKIEIEEAPFVQPSPQYTDETREKVEGILSGKIPFDKEFIMECLKPYPEKKALLEEWLLKGSSASSQLIEKVREVLLTVYVNDDIYD